MASTQRTLQLPNPSPPFNGASSSPQERTSFAIAGVDANLLARADAEAAKLDSILIRHERFNEVLLAAVTLALRQGTTRHPGGGRVIAPSRCGKTTLCRRLMSAFPPADLEGKPSVPVLIVECDANVSALSLLKGMLDKLHYPFTGRRTAAELEQPLCDALKEYEVKLILIDEANHISEGEKGRSAHAIGDALKRLYDRSHVPMILLGTPALEKLFMVNSQLDQRLAGIYSLVPFEFGVAFSDMLKTLRTSLPVPCEVVLEDPEPAYAILLATQGRMGAVIELLKSAVRVVIDEGMSTIDRSVLIRAHERRYGKGKENPLRIDHGKSVESYLKQAKART